MLPQTVILKAKVQMILGIHTYGCKLTHSVAILYTPEACIVLAMPQKYGM
jgi:hypothetical protein